ncbi:MAG: protein translocase subunit SecD [Candidatus Coatesbacteria bacterium]|nr:protein translocase subunit SecD [Candidatus Coatesbacteria bacterium]
MKKNLLAKSIFAIALVVLVGWCAFPPKEKVILGLDLKGGIHLVLEVETSSALKGELSEMRQRLGDFLRDREIPIESESVADDLSIRFVLPTASARDLALAQFSDEKSRFNTSSTRLDGDKYELKLVFTSEEDTRLRESAVRQALETIRNRVDELGVAEPTIQRVGMTGDRILVQLPGVVDPERAKNIIGRTAMLQLRLMKDEAPTKEALLDKNAGKVPDGFEILKMTPPRQAKTPVERYAMVEKEVRVSGADLEDARIGHDEFNMPAVDFRLSTSAGRLFGKFTESHLNERLAIVLDNIVESAPVIRSRITDRGQITGSFTVQDAEDLSVVLRAGALPATVRYLEERTVGPSLGQDSINQGTISALVGGALVILFMLFYYRFAGVIADVALMLNLVLLMGCLALSGAALTLPGIAGIILTLGMAVDANVLIFERIKEDLKAGKTTKAAVEGGFKRALLTIVDANVTTLIAAVVLFQFGTGPIRGFAVTLIIGIIASMFTALFMAKLAFEIMIQKFNVKKLSI